MSAFESVSVWTTRFGRSLVVVSRPKPEYVSTRSSPLVGMPAGDQLLGSHHETNRGPTQVFVTACAETRGRRQTTATNSRETNLDTLTSIGRIGRSYCTRSERPPQQTRDRTSHHSGTDGGRTVDAGARGRRLQRRRPRAP